MSEPKVWGDGCECWVVPESMWTTHYGAVEPGSQVEYNPECPMHGEAPGKCAACGKDPAEGYARVNDDWYCHPDEGFSCYAGGAS